MPEKRRKTLAPHLSLTGRYQGGEHLLAPPARADVKESNSPHYAANKVLRAGAPSRICSEPPSLKSGEIVHKRIIFSGI
jgi:hypothetical protein